jgi:hypothetical protein
MAMIDVVQALELLEICAADAAGQDAPEEGGTGVAPHRRMSLAERALARRQLHVSDLAPPSFGGRPRHDSAAPDGSKLTLGAVIAFRTADRFERAGGSTAHTLEAAHRAVARYAELISSALLTGVALTEAGAPAGRSKTFAAAGSTPTPIQDGPRR